ncbi:MAG: hypothetical protein NVS9B9_27930 [Ktedonobacteraceae bacterium]
MYQMLLSQSQVQSLKAKDCTGCRGVSKEDISYMFDSYEILVEILMELRYKSGCWCHLLGGEHNQLCRKIQRIFT